MLATTRPARGAAKRGASPLRRPEALHAPCGGGTRLPVSRSQTLRTGPGRAKRKPGCALSGLLLLQNKPDALREDLAQHAADLFAVAVHQVDEERVEGWQVLGKLPLVEAEQALQQRHDSGLELAQRARGELRSRAVRRVCLRHLAQLEEVAQHVEREGDEPVFDGRRDEKRVLLGTEGGRLGVLGGHTRRRLKSRVERE
mmetsp:Transcript_36170/g.79494  ORF Transcript_36170/g.79494 Transcript_36170/m.79494 type:complete len:200 (+) Transcript_36170:504-1103(+)